MKETGITDLPMDIVREELKEEKRREYKRTLKGRRLGK
jgi:hypothetical protein